MIKNELKVMMCLINKKSVSLALASYKNGSRDKSVKVKNVTVYIDTKNDNAFKKYVASDKSDVSEYECDVIHDYLNRNEEFQMQFASDLEV